VRITQTHLPVQDPPRHLARARKLACPACQDDAVASLPRDAGRARELVLEASRWQKNGDTGTARDLLEQAVQFDPDNAEAHNRLGHLYLNSQPERARRHLEDARRLDGKTYREEVDNILKQL